MHVPGYSNFAAMTSVNIFGSVCADAPISDAKHPPINWVSLTRSHITRIRATGCTMCAEESASGRSARPGNNRESWGKGIMPILSFSPRMTEFKTYSSFHNRMVGK